MHSLPAINTDRLYLRKPLAEDISHIVTHANNPKVANMTLNMPYPYHTDDAIQWIAMANKGIEDKSHVIFAITNSADNAFMGGIGLRVNERFNRAELGFWLGEPFWNQGYMSEAVPAVIKFGFRELKLHKIVARHLPNNPASGRVMIKNGMIKEGELKDHVRRKGKYLSLIQYRLTKPEYETAG